ncbi:recombinase [Bacillus halotolerans]|nr:recombinase [Bacillus halotolerans]
MIAIYVRVSTEEQAIKGSSIDSQIEACIKNAGTKDVLKYADEKFSGELFERPAFNRLREDASKGLISKLSSMTQLSLMMISLIPFDSNGIKHFNIYSLCRYRQIQMLVS